MLRFCLLFNLMCEDLFLDIVSRHIRTDLVHEGADPFLNLLFLIFPLRALHEQNFHLREELDFPHIVELLEEVWHLAEIEKHSDYIHGFGDVLRSLLSVCFVKLVLELWL